MEAYVFPDTAVAMERAIRDRVRRGEYERITSAQTLADSLTAHLQAVSQDRHLRVRYSDEPPPRLDAQQRPTPPMEAPARAPLRGQSWQRLGTVGHPRSGEHKP